MAMTRKGAIAAEMPIFFTPPPVRGGRYTSGLWAGGSPPAPPDPVATAKAQGEANIDAARISNTMNRYDSTNPFGASTWTQDPNNPDKWSNTTTLDPKIQGMLDQYFDSTKYKTPAIRDGMPFIQPLRTGAQYQDVARDQMDGHKMDAAVNQSNGVALHAGNLADNGLSRLDKLYSKDLDYSGAPEMPGANEAARKSIEDAYYGKVTARLDPRFKNDEAEMRSRLANQGLTEGSEAYNKELQQFMMGKNDAYSGATNDAILNSTGEMQKLFGMGLAARQQGVSEANYLRDQPLKEAQGVMGLYGQGSGINQSNMKTQSDLFDSASARAGRDANTDLALRSSGFNELGALHQSEQGDRQDMLNQLMAMRSGTQVNAQGFTPTQVGAAPVAQSIYNSNQGAQNNYNAQVGQQNAMLGAGASLGAAAIMAF